MLLNSPAISMQLHSISKLAGLSTPTRDGASLVLHQQRLYLFGGRDSTGAPSGQLYMLEQGSPASSWVAVKQNGDVPPPRYAHNAMLWGEQLWVYDGFTAGHSSPLGDLRRFEFLTNSWCSVEQQGLMPDRGGHHNYKGAGHYFRGWHRTVTYGPYMLAFGSEQQDENFEPRGAAAAAPPAAPMLHAFDFCTSTWSWVPTQGSPAFTHLEGLFVHGDRLIAIGWTPGPVSTPQLSPTASGNVPQTTPPIHSTMQVSTIDMTSHGSGQLRWSKPQQPPLCDTTLSNAPPPATTRCAMAICEDQIVMHGGALCGVAARGGGVQLADHMYALGVETFAWTKLGNAETSQPLGHTTCPAVSSADDGTPPAKCPPLARFNHATCYGRVGGTAVLYLVGGSTSPLAFASCPVTEAVVLHVRPSPVKAPSSHPGAADRTPLIPQALNLASDLSDYCCNEWMSDVTLVAHNTLFPAHRIVLCAASTKFKSLLKAVPEAGSLHDRGKLKVELDDVEPHVLKLMLQYIYGKKLDELTPQQAPDLFSASHRYGLPVLREACLQLMMRSLSVHNVTAYVLLADQLDNLQLMEACIAFTSECPQRLQEVIASPGYLTLTEYSAQIGQKLLTAVIQRVIKAPSDQRGA